MIIRLIVTIKATISFISLEVELFEVLIAEILGGLT